MKSTRWQQRFENFEKAFLLLKSVFPQDPAKPFSVLEREGIIQRFEYTYELAWKTLKDYLEYSGVAIEQVTPRHVIKLAFAAGLIKDGQIWINMADHRNLLSHTYNQNTFEKAIDAISSIYLHSIEQLYLFLKQQDAAI